MSVSLFKVNNINNNNNNNNNTLAWNGAQCVKKKSRKH